MTKIKTLADTNTATWFDEFIKLYLNNYLAGQKNKDCLDKLDSEFVIKAQDSNKKIETNTSSIYLVKLFSFKLPTIVTRKDRVYFEKFKSCVSARVLLTGNILVFLID